MEKYLISLYENTEYGLEKLKDFFVYVDKEISELEIDADALIQEIKNNEKTIREGIKEYKYLIELNEKNSKDIKECQLVYNFAKKKVDKQLEKIEYKFEELDVRIEILNNKKNIMDTKDEEIKEIINEIMFKKTQFENKITELKIIKNEYKGLIDNLMIEIEEIEENINYLKEKLKTEAGTTSTVFSTIVDEWLETLLSITINFDTPSYFPEETSIAYIKNNNKKSIEYTTSKPCDVSIKNQNNGLVYYASDFKENRIVTPALIPGINNLEMINVSEKGYNEKISNISIYAFETFLENLIFDEENSQLINNELVLNYDSTSLGTFNFKESVIEILKDNSALIDDYTIELYFDNILIDTLIDSNLSNYSFHNMLNNSLINSPELFSFFQDATEKTKNVLIKSILKIPSENIIAEDLIMKRILMPILDLDFEWIYELIYESSKYVNCQLDLSLSPSISVASIELFFKVNGEEILIFRILDLKNYLGNLNEINLEKIIRESPKNNALGAYYKFYRNDNIEMVARLYRETYFKGKSKDVEFNYFIEKPYFKSDAWLEGYENDVILLIKEMDYFNNVYNNHIKTLKICTNIRNVNINDCEIKLHHSKKNLLTEPGVIVTSNNTSDGSEFEVKFDPTDIDIRDFTINSDKYWGHYKNKSSTKLYIKGDVFDYASMTNFDFAPAALVDKEQVIESITKTLHKVDIRVGETLNLKTPWNVVFTNEKDSKLFINIGLLTKNTNGYTGIHNYKTLYDNYDNDNGFNFFTYNTIEEIEVEEHSYAIPITPEMVNDVVKSAYSEFIIRIETGHYSNGFNERDVVTSQYYQFDNIDLVSIYDFDFDIDEPDKNSNYFVDINDNYNYQGDELSIGYTSHDNKPLFLEVYIDNNRSPFYRFDNEYNIDGYNIYHKNSNNDYNTHETEAIVNKNGLVIGENTLIFKAKKYGTDGPWITKARNIRLRSV